MVGVPPPFFPFFFKLKKKENPRNPTGTRDGFFSFLDLIIQEIIKRKKKRGMAVTILEAEVQQLFFTAEEHRASEPLYGKRAQAGMPSNLVTGTDTHEDRECYVFLC